MELQIDLLNNLNKSKLRIIIGFALIVVICILIVDKVLANKSFKIFDWIYIIVFIISGIVYIYEGFGLSIGNLFGKAFIFINKEIIDVKLSIFDKENNIKWQNIKSINYKTNKFYINKLDNTSINLDLTKLNYSVKLQVKTTIITIAQYKNIPIQHN